MREKAMTIKTWWDNSTAKQKIIVGIGIVLIMLLMVAGILMLIPDSIFNPSTIKTSEKVTVNDIEAEFETQAIPVPAETIAVVPVATDTGNITESNVTTVEIPAVASEPTYTDENTGGRYEASQDTETYSEPTYTEPTGSEPTYTQPVTSDNSWDIGGDVADKTGGEDYGTGVSN